MPSPPELIRRFAEEPDGFLPDPPPPMRRIARASFVLTLSPSPTMSTVSQVRTSEDQLDETIEQVRQLVRQSGYIRAAWRVGPSCTPSTLALLLRERGFLPATRPLEPTLTAMALLTPPTAPPSGVEARLVADFDEYVASFRIAFDVFGVSEEARAALLAALPEMWKAHSDGSSRITHLVFVDEKLVGFSSTLVGAIGLVLDGSGVLPEARGRGVYRALVAARWAEAVKRDTPALVVQAGSMSGPILERCGFEPICKLDLLDDAAIMPPAE